MSTLEEYQAYYKTRMERFENNPLYPNSYQSEKALYDAIASCSELEDFKGKLESGNLNIKNAIALIKDKYIARLAHFKELKEDIRALGPERVLSKIDQAATDLEVVNMVSDIEVANGIEIAVDEFTDTFYTSTWKVLEDIEVYEKAEIPDQYKAEFQSSIDEMKKSIRDRYQQEEENNTAWKAGWKFDFDLIWEERHRRKIPFKDDMLTKRINQAKQIKGVS